MSKSCYKCLNPNPTSNGWCLPCKNLWQQKHRAKNKWLYIFYGIKARCSNSRSTYAKREIECLIKKEEVKFLWNRDKAYLMNKPSIDRINTEGNYTLENCRFIEEVCNQSRMKSRVNEKNPARGVHFRNVGKPWMVQFCMNRKSLYFGRYDKLEKAVEVASNVEQQLTR